MKIKVCCIASPEEAAMAINAGATSIGLVSAMPSGPGVITLEQITAIVQMVPDDIDTFLLTSASDATTIVSQLRKTGANTVQCVVHMDIPTLKAIRAKLPTHQIVQVIHITGPESLVYAQEISPFVDALLLDSGRPNQAILGGTGQTHDWSISAKICAMATVPVYLAGGLNAANVAQAIATVRPHGLDICSGVRDNDALDRQKLRAFFSAIEMVS